MFLASSVSQPITAKAPVDLLNQVAHDLGGDLEGFASLDIKRVDLNDDGQSEYIVTYSCGAHRCLFHVYGKKEDRWLRLLEDGSSDGEYKIEMTSTQVITKFPPNISLWQDILVFTLLTTSSMGRNT